MSKVAKATIGLMIVTMLSKVLGLGRELVLGSIYGASNYSDIYITTMNITTILFSGIGSTLITTFIPLYFENYELGGEEQANRFSNNILNIVIVIGTILSIMAFIFVKPLVKVFALGFEGDTLNMAIQFTKIMIFGGIFIGINNIMTAILQTRNNFIIPGMASIPFNIIIMISIILSAKFNIIILPIGTLIAIASQGLFQYLFSGNKGYRYKFILDFRCQYVKKMIYLIAPIFIGVAVGQINVMIDRTLASTLAEGSISALNYADKLNGFVTGLFILSIGAVIYPVLSKLSLNDNKIKFADTVVKSINSVILLVTPISIGAIVLSTPIVKIIFQRGAFDERAVAMTSTALIFYSVGMVAYGLREILNKAFYSLQDTKTPMINGIICVILNIIINLILVKFMGHNGLALGTSLSAIICVILLVSKLSKIIEDFKINIAIKTFIKSLVASIVMGGATFIAYKAIVAITGAEFIGNLISIILSVIVGVIIYGILVIILKIDEIKIAIDIILKNIKR